MERCDGMETTELEAAVYAAITDNADLMSAIADIYHLQAPGGNSLRYPYIVYSPISDDPALSGDNLELEHRVTMRFHVVTKDGEYAVVYQQLKSILQELGFRRVRTMPYIEDGEKILITDFKIGVES